MNIKPGRAYSILLIYVILVILYHLFGYTGHFGYDDIHYAELAADLLNGSVNFEDHYAYRFPVILFTSLFYLIFGISDLSSSLPAMVVTITILIIVFNILKAHGPRVLIVGLSLCTLSNWFLFYSDKLMPDIYVALSVIWALAIIHRYKFRSDKSKPLLHAFLLALLLLLGFMSKGTIVLIFPLLIFLVLTDIIRKRDARFWAYSLLSGLVLMSLYLLIIWILTGDQFKRFEAIADNSYLNLCSYDQQSLKILLKRIFFGFFELSIFQSLATGFIFVFTTLFQRKGLHIFRMDDSFSFFQTSAVILFLSSSFMTISLSSYAPMCLDPRHYLFLVPVAAIPAARIIADYMESKKAAIQILVALTAVTITSYFLQGNSFWKLYLPLTALFVAFYFVKHGKQVQYLFILLFSVILLLAPLDMIRYAWQVKYRTQKAFVVEQVLNKHQDYMIVTNEVQLRLLDYYSGFREDQSQRFLSYDEYEIESSRDDKTLLLLNGYTRYLSGMNLNDLPVFARNIPPDIKPLSTSEELNLAIFEMKDLPLMDLEEILLFTSLNDFEHHVPYWKQDERELSKEIKYAGARSNRIPEFSSTFEYPLDSLQMEASHELLIHCSLYVYAEDQTNAKIIVSIEGATGISLWKALEVNSYIKAYSNWWPLSYSITIPQDDLLPDSHLKVYVWKSDDSEVYIDNFSVKIIGILLP